MKNHCTGSLKITHHSIFMITHGWPSRIKTELIVSHGNPFEKKNKNKNKNVNDKKKERTEIIGSVFIKHNT